MMAELELNGARKFLITEYPTKYDPEIVLVKLEEASGGLVANLYERVGENLEIAQLSADEPVLYRFSRNKEVVKETQEPFV